jgi:hypothetical protein
VALKRGFPQVDNAEILRVLEANAYDPRKAVRALMKKGYTPNNAPAPK